MADLPFPPAAGDGHTHDSLASVKKRETRPLRSSRAARLPSLLSSPAALKTDADLHAEPSHSSLPPPPPSLEQRKAFRNMWQLASVHNFLSVFRPVLNLELDFSMDELETALLMPNTLLDTLHISLLKGIPPISRAHMNRETWVTCLSRKMKEWWSWVAEGECPLVPHHGEENVMYKNFTPDIRVIILKALCELRLDQDDIRTFIDEELKKGTPLSTMRKEIFGDDKQGTIYWYENGPVAGQRLYREIQVPCKRDKLNSNSRNSLVPPPTFQWETLATNLEEFESVVEKLCSSKNKLEVSIGKKIDSDIIPELNKLQQKKERALKRQQRQAQLIDNHTNIESLAMGRSRRERKPVTYTFDDFDKSINDAIQRSKSIHASPALVVEDNIISKSSNYQIDLESADNGSDYPSHIHSELDHDNGQYCRYVENDEAAGCSEDEREIHTSHCNKRKRRQKPGSDKDGNGENGDYDENGCGDESNMEYTDEEEDNKINALEISRRKLKAENVQQGLPYSEGCINGHHERMDFGLNKKNEDIKDRKVLGANVINEEPISDLNLAVVGNGVQNACSRGQNNSRCFVVKVEKVGV